MADVVPFPFLALVGQPEMKLALLLAMINHNMGGVLLIGPRGTGKTTAVRSLPELLPQAPRSLCYYGCLPEDIEAGGVDAVCPDCAKKYAEDEPLAVLDQVRLVELPLNARLEDVVGGLDERAALQGQIRLRRGILAQADRNLLYVDEVNLLSDEVVDAILDAAAQGYYLVRRGPMSSTYRARFVLVGSMNPEEGRLRPQILDRFGLRVVVRGLPNRDERLEAYKRAHAYLTNPRQVSAEFSDASILAQEDIQAARDLLPQVEIPDKVSQQGLELVERLKVDSLRAEITMFEAARAHAVADARLKVTSEDLLTVAPMALRLRRSNFIDDYFTQYEFEEQELTNILDDIIPQKKPKKKKGA
ncbi:MAG: ATP-binding protein [Anaerolineales bacterium]|nr:ATP-binding protein [Chloroflexota bacterium]MBL6982062.1 ATP-binding protein [Anaerolineales bacterium]